MGLLRVLCIEAEYAAKREEMDTGLEFISATLAERTDDHGIQLEFIKPGKPTQNSYVERFNRKCFFIINK